MSACLGHLAVGQGGEHSGRGQSRGDGGVYTWAEEYVEGVSCESLLHIQAPRASHFFIFPNQITPGSKHLLLLLTGLTRNIITAIFWGSPTLVRSHCVRGVHESREEGKSCLLTRVVGTMSLPCSLCYLVSCHLQGTRWGLGSEAAE